MLTKKVIYTVVTLLGMLLAVRIISTFDAHNNIDILKAWFIILWVPLLSLMITWVLFGLLERNSND